MTDSLRQIWDECLTFIPLQSGGYGFEIQYLQQSRLTACPRRYKTSSGFTLEGLLTPPFFSGLDLAMSSVTLDI